jgi:hypothetical protein
LTNSILVHECLGDDSVWVPESAVLGSIDQGLAIAQTFVHENRIRQAEPRRSWLLDEFYSRARMFGRWLAPGRSIPKPPIQARARKIWGEGKSLADNQAIQFPVVELMTQVEMLFPLSPYLPRPCAIDASVQAVSCSPAGAGCLTNSIVTSGR